MHFCVYNLTTRPDPHAHVQLTTTSLVYSQIRKRSSHHLYIDDTVHSVKFLYVPERQVYGALLQPTLTPPHSRPNSQNRALNIRGVQTCNVCLSEPATDVWTGDENNVQWSVHLCRMQCCNGVVNLLVIYRA